MNYTKDTRDTCILILLTSLLILIPIGLYFDFIYNNQSLPIIETPIETIKDNKCIFDLFTEVFKVSNSSYVYYPSYFSPIRMISIQSIESISMLDNISKEQDLMFKDLIKVFFDSLRIESKLSN